MQSPLTPASSSSSPIFLFALVKRIVRSNPPSNPRVSIVLDAEVIEVVSSSPTAPLELLGQGPKKGHLTIRYEPPSAKFKQRHPGLLSYRISISYDDSPDSVMSLRGLPETLILGPSGELHWCEAVWILFESSAVRQSVIDLLKGTRPTEDPLPPPTSARYAELLNLVLKSTLAPPTPSISMADLNSFTPELSLASIVHRAEERKKEDQRQRARNFTPGALIFSPLLAVTGRATIVSAAAWGLAYSAQWVAKIVGKDVARFVVFK